MGAVCQRTGRRGQCRMSKRETVLAHPGWCLSTLRCKRTAHTLALQQQSSPTCPCGRSRTVVEVHQLAVFALALDQGWALWGTSGGAAFAAGAAPERSP